MNVARHASLVIAVALALVWPSAGSGQNVARAAAVTSLSGSWKFDRSQTKDNQDAWRRRVDAMRITDPATFGQTNSDPTASSIARTVESPDWLLRSALRDLLEIAERLSFQVDDASVTITDDLNRVLTFATTGTREKRQLAATEFDAKTTWTGAALTQDIRASSLQLTEVYLPSKDGRQMIVSIKVVKPQFQPPLKDILRVYVRTGE